MKHLRVGIVGAAGQVGLALLKDLNRDGEFSAFGICRNRVSSARVASIGLPVRTVETDNSAQLIDATRDLDVLVNCALPQYQPSKTSAANLRLAESLTASCAGKHLLHLSSVAVYGEFLSSRERLFVDPKPDTSYGRQKLQMEQLLRKLSKKHSAKCTILRVGHVYGPQLRWSEALFDLVKTENFRLPFDGQLPSNAVWIKNLIAGIRYALISGSTQGTLNLVDTPQSTWREVFDLHSHACGCPPVAALDKFESQRSYLNAKKRSEVGIAARFAHETWAWIKHLPASYVASVPSFKAISQRLVAKIGSERLDSKLYASYCRHLSHRDDSQSTPAILPLLLSEPIPGQYLAYEGKSPVECGTALISWHDAISSPGLIERLPLLSRRKVATTTCDLGSLR
jgi:nucleoside-diphosphate-sugar epimerase